MADLKQNIETEDEDFSDYHTGNATGEFRCTFPGCGSVMKYRKHLKDHYKNHSGERPFKCDECEKSFGREYHLKRHKAVHLNDDTGIRCSYENCTYRCKFNSNLKRHIRRIHESDKPFKCSFKGCPVSFKKHKDRTAHEALHRGEKPFNCEEDGCDKSYMSHRKLKEHMKKHKKEKGYVCSNEKCDAIFYSWTELQKHNFVCTVHECHACGKVFKAAWQLKAHQVVHNSNRTLYKCPMENCDREYTTESNVVAHVRSCHGEQDTFVCPEENCGQSFAHKCSLKRHLANHEKIMELYKRIARNKKKREKKRRKQTRIRTSTMSKVTGLVSELERYVSSSDVDIIPEDEGYSESGEEMEGQKHLFKINQRLTEPSIVIETATEI